MGTQSLVVERLSYGPERIKPLISIVIPTIDGRERWLEKCLLSYQMNRPESSEILIVRNRRTCGIAWNIGLDHAEAPYIHLTADDIEAHPGWWEAAIKVVRRDQLPAPRILNPDGSLQSCGDANEMENGEECEIARIPFASREQFDAIGQMFTRQYYGDNWFSHRGRQLGWPSIICREYLFTHHLAGEGRIDTLAEDGAAFFRARRSS